MNSIEIWHNPRCGKSREALKLLIEKGVDPVIRLYLDNPPNAVELKEALKRLNISVAEILRKGESLYKETYSKRIISTAEWLEILHQHPILIERPIVFTPNGAVIARPPDKLLDII